MAWGLVDICVMGDVPWDIFNTGACRVKEGAGALPGRDTVCRSGGDDGVGFVQVTGFRICSGIL